MGTNGGSEGDRRDCVSALSFTETAFLCFLHRFVCANAWHRCAQIRLSQGGWERNMFPHTETASLYAAFRGLRPRAPSGFSLAGKATKRAHRGQVCPLCTPSVSICNRRGCPVPFDDAYCRALACLPLTDRRALRPPPLAADVSCRFILRECFCASYAE